MARMEVMFPSLTQSESVLNERYTVTVIEQALRAALNTMMLGEAEQANRIVDFLYKHNNFEFAPLQVLQLFHFAWNASDCWPKPYRDPEDGKLPPARENWEHGPSRVPSMENKKRTGWAESLERDPVDADWTFSDFSKARESAAQELPWSYAASVDIALGLGLDDIAGEIIRTHLVELLKKAPDVDVRGIKEPESFDILESPRMWNVLNDGFLRKELDISREQIEAHVDTVLENLEMRLTQGAMASLKPKSIKELCHIFDQRCIARKELGNRGGNRSYDDGDRDELPKTFLKEPASEAAIEESQAKAIENGLVGGFPQDYLDFLKATNGIYPINEPDSQQAIFYPVQEVNREGEWQMELLPHESLGMSYNGDMHEWPEFNPWVDVGSGGDEGNQWIVGKTLFQPALDMFEEIYKEASPGDRMRIERAANDLYGGVNELRNAEVVVVRFYHWAAETEIFKDFRTLLECTVTDVLGEKERSDNNEEEEEDGDDIEEDNSDDGTQAENQVDEDDDNGEISVEEGEDVDEEDQDEDFEDRPADKVKKRRRG